jgi:hypothetical protein
MRSTIYSVHSQHHAFSESRRLATDAAGMEWRIVLFGIIHRALSSFVPGTDKVVVLDCPVQASLAERPMFLMVLLSSPDSSSYGCRFPHRLHVTMIVLVAISPSPFLPEGSKRFARRQASTVQ